MPEKITPRKAVFWSPRRQRSVLLAVVIALCIGAAIQALIDTSRSSSINRGDFPAFYAAGQIVRLGRGSELYEPGLQAELENEAWPSLEGRYLHFAYPPYVAVLCSPLADEQVR